LIALTRPRAAIQLISTGGLYGAERALLELASYLEDQGWGSHVVALEGQGATRLVDRARALGLAAEAFVPTGRLGLWPMMQRLRQLLGKYPRAIVHSHGYKPDILLSVLGTSRHLPCLATCHNWISETRKMQLLEALDKRVLRGFDHVVAVSGRVSEELTSSGVSAQKVSLIKNGISAPTVADGARQAIREEFGLSTRSKVVAQIGRLARSKRTDLLLAAVSSLPADIDVHVLLVGEGDQAQSLAELVKSQRLERRVHFCGYRSDIAQILVAADLLALTSEKEGLPIAILEAMAMRCPIVSTSVGEIPQVLSDPQDAWLVPPNDLSALTAAIHEALTDPGEAETRAANAHALFLRQYSRDSMGAHYLEIYEKVWTQRGWREGAND
jgi:glycosyltransferase involved in cell wall biosynthesis